MKVLHICNDYFGGSFYKDIFTGLNEKYDVEQIIFVFLRKDQVKLLKSKKMDEFSPKIKIVYINYILSFWGRIFPIFRNIKLFIYLNRNTNIRSIDIIHAHTLYSNGSLAFLLFKFYKIPYIISVRNTDINKVLKYFIHQRRFLRNILINAKAVIFLNPAYRLRLGSFISLKRWSLLKEKSKVIPNSISNFWFQNIGVAKKISSKNNINILFVGEISANKNIDFMIKVFGESWRSDLTFKVNIIGHVKRNKKGLLYYKKFKKMINGLNNVQYLGEIREKNLLRKYYNTADIFFMVSATETFGLVYIEAMTQGTPVIYTKGEGIDGYFKDGEVGYSVNPWDISDARKKVDLIIQDYNKISTQCILNSKKFSTDKVIEELYKNYLNYAKN